MKKRAAREYRRLAIALVLATVDDDQPERTGGTGGECERD